MHKLKDLLIRYLDKNFSCTFMSYKRITAIMFPVFLDQLSLVVLAMFNMGMISASGAFSVSAVGMVDTLNSVISQLYLSISMGGTILVAKYTGSENRSLVSASAVQALTTAGLLAAGLGLILGIFRGPILSTLYRAADPEIIELAKIYLLGLAIASPAIAFINVSNGILRGTGDTMASLVISLSTNVTFALLNVLFLAILNMGIRGLFSSIIISRVFGTLCSVWFLTRREVFLHFHLKDIIHADWTIQKKLFRFGVPFAAENMFFNGGGVAIQIMIVSLGTASIALHAICVSILAVMVSASESLCNTVVAIAGQCLGRNDIDQARRYIRSFIRIGQTITAVMLVLILIFFPLIMKLYNADPELERRAFFILAISGIFLSLFWPVGFITPSGLRTAGDVRFTSLAVLLSMWTIRVSLCYVLAVVLGFGLEGVWAAMCFEWISRAVIFTLRFRTNRWHNNAVSM